MEREIKFRLWNIKDKCWDSPSLLEVWDDSGKLEPYQYVKSGTLNPLYIPKENYVIHQYTGCKDKNGTEIYEGDIVKYCLFIENEKEQWDTGSGVVFELGCFWVGSRKANGMNISSPDYKPGEPALMCWQSPKWLEVIGNIFENPDVIE
jgi:uncharacterized phage protein (TIGR01671 family)